MRTVPMTGGLLENNGLITSIPDSLASYVVNGFQANDIIYSSVMMIMDKISAAPWGLYKVVDEKSLKQYKSFMMEGKWREAANIRSKALEPIVNMNRQTGRLAELLQWPNDEETFNELIAADAGFLCITGNNYMYGNLLDKGTNEGLPAELWNLPAQYISIKATRQFPQRKVGYQLNNGEIQQFATTQILHEKLFNPSYSASGAGLYGQSPIKAGIRTVRRSNSSKKAGAVYLDNNGAANIIYVDDDKVPVSGREKQAELIKKAWYEGHTGPEHYGKNAFSGWKMGVAQVGNSLKDMDLGSIEKIDLRVIANLLGLPSQLLNDPDNKTYNNAKEAEKALTSRCAIPKMTKTRNSFNRKLQTDWGFKGVNVYVDYDMSVYTELQEDQKEKWEWVDKLPVPSRYKLEMMGLDVPDDPNMDVILVDGTKIPLSEVINVMSDDELQAMNESLNKAGMPDYLRVAK